MVFRHNSGISYKQKILIKIERLYRKDVYSRDSFERNLRSKINKSLEMIIIETV